MNAGAPPLTLAMWLLAALPIVALFLLVVSNKVPTPVAAAVTAALALATAAVFFRAGGHTLLVALGKGAWLGFWILCVVWPALLLYRIAKVGGLERIGEFLQGVLATRQENLLLTAWLLPSFIQGVAGFGTPIAVAAPLLRAMGYDPVRAIVYPLIGYHWSVTFGSMGSSFYMASLTAGLSDSAQVAFGTRAALQLGVNCLVAGALLLLMDGGLRGLRKGARTLFAVGLPMAAALVLGARAVPAVTTLSACTVGIAVVLALGRRHAKARTPGQAPPPGPQTRHARPVSPAVLLAPYGYLLATALPVFLIPWSRQWVTSNLQLGFSFPATATALGWSTPAAERFTPLALFGHPGVFIALACLLGYLTYRWARLWDRDAAAMVLPGWLRSLPQASLSILLLAVVATVLVEAGMVNVLAGGIAQSTGGAFVVLSPLVGALGSFVTGSTTSANALFAALQHDVAGLIGVPGTALLGGQTTGANVGNALAPVVIMVGATALGTPDLAGRVLRKCLLPVAVLLVVTAATTLMSARLFA